MKRLSENEFTHRRFRFGRSLLSKFARRTCKYFNSNAVFDQIFSTLRKPNRNLGTQIRIRTASNDVVSSFCHRISVRVVGRALLRLVSPVVILAAGVSLSASLVKGDEEPMARSSWDRLHESFYTREQERRVLGSRLLASLNLAESASAVFSTRDAESFLNDAQELVKDLQKNAPIYRQDSGEFVGIINYRLHDVDFKHYIPLTGDDFPADKYQFLFNVLAVSGARTVGVSLRRIAWVFDLGEVAQGIREAQRNLRTNAGNVATKGIGKLVDSSVSYLDTSNTLLEARQLLEFSRLLLESKNITGAQYAVRGVLTLLSEANVGSGNTTNIRKLATIRKSLEAIEGVLSVPPLKGFDGVNIKIQRIVDLLREL
jgi:hypothetical protein